MLGLLGKLSLGAGRVRSAGGGLTPIALLSASLLLAACQVPQHPSRTANSAAPTAVDPIEPTEAEPTEVAAPALAPKPVPLDTTPAVAHADSVMPASLHLTGDPNELLGLDNAALRRSLGKPVQIRNEYIAQVWQYVTGDCVVDLYLYDRDGGLKVTYVEARSRSAEPTPTNRCLKSLLERPTASIQ